MTEKLRYKIGNNELEIVGEFDETTALSVNQKGKLLNATGDFIGLGWDEGDDILYGQSGILPSQGSFGNPYNRYTQTNISIETRELATKDGNRFAYVIHRAPDISSTSTWGGVSLFPDSTLMRKSNNKFRFSFDYRGYSNGNTMDVYHNYSIGWGSFGINLPTPWSNGISSFDTDWEWRHYSFEFTVTDALLNVVAGTYDWNSTTQYPASGDYGIRYNGNLYRHRNANPAPTLGTDPETEYQAGGTYGVDQIYDAKWTGGAAAGFFNVYANMKIGFTYQSQGERGTHVHVDNIMLTNITENESFKYDVTNGTWIAETLVDDGLDILAKGTAYMTQARSVNTALDIFSIEGSRVLEVNGTSISPASGRGLTLVVLNSSGSVVSNTVYDVHGSGTASDSLATALAGVSSGNYWVLMSFDAIGSESTHNNSPNLRNQLISMGSRMWNPNEGNLYLWSFSSGDVRNPYAAVGKGNNLIKEDGSSASDTVYKRKGVIQTRIS
jgi:hypothetical protein